MSLRLRLTVLYGGLFLLAGGLLLGLTYVLFNRQLSRRMAVFVSLPDSVDPSPLPPPETLVDQARLLHEAASATLLTQGAIALGTVAVLAAVVGWVVAGRVLAPLHRVTDTALRIAATADLSAHERIELRGPDDEVKNLANAFDVMVERLDRSFDGQRRFVANASHELRTPLTLNRSLVEVAMHRKTASKDIRELGEKLLLINSRHERLISGLLLLARSENALTERFPVDLAAVVAHVLAQIPKAGITVREQIGEAVTLGDALLLERLVHNLVENGIRHNVEEGWLRVTTRTRETGVEIEVSNSGPEIPADEVPALFEPFHRRTRAAAEGAGVGLSIVRSVTHAHGGVVVARARPGGGLVVVVSVPSG